MRLNHHSSSVNRRRHAEEHLEEALIKVMEDSEAALQVVCMGQVCLDGAWPVGIKGQVVLVQLCNGRARHKCDVLIVNWKDYSKPSLETLTFPPPPASPSSLVKVCEHHHIFVFVTSCRHQRQTW